MMTWGTIGSTEQIDGASGRPWTLRFERRLAPRESAKITNAASSVWLVRDVSPEGRGLLYAAKRQTLASLAEVDALVDEAAAWRAACLADDTDPSRKIITELHDVFVERDGTPPYTVTFIAEFCSRGLLPRGHARLSEPVLLTLVSDLAMVARVMPSPHAHIAYESLLVDSKGRVRVGGFGAHRSAILRDNPGMTNRDDVFDIGLLLYELIFGQPPPENDLTVPRDSQVPYSPALLDLVEMALNQSMPTELYDAALRAGAHPLAPVINVDASTTATHDGALQVDAPEHVARATERNVDRLVEGIDIAPAFNALLADLEADGAAVSSSVFKSLFRKPISKDPLSAMRALTMIHNLLLDGPEAMLASVRKNDKFMSWTETSWMGEAVNAKCNENPDGLDAEVLSRLRCFQGGEISFYAALLRRKATFHQLAAGGFTGRWDRTGAINPQTQRDVLGTRRRKVIQGMADVVEMASELGCRFAAAQDTEAPSKHAALGAMVSECCLAYNAALELAMQVASVQEAEKLAAGIARLYAAARALVFAVERVPSAGGESWVEQFSAETPPDIVTDFEMRQRMTMGGDTGAEEADFPKAGWEGGADVANEEDEKKKKKKKKKKKSDKNKTDGDDIKAEDGALVVHGADEEAKQSVATMFGDLLSIDESQNAAKEQSETARPLPDMSNAQALASAFGVPEEAVEDRRPAYEYGEHDNYDEEDEAGGYEDYQARKQHTAPPRDSSAPSTGAWAAQAGYGHQALVTATSVAKKHPVYYQCALSEVEQAAELDQSQTQAYSADYGNDGNVGYDTSANQGRSRDVDGHGYDEQERAYQQQKQQNYGRYDSNPDSLEDDEPPENNARSQQGGRPQQQQQYYENDYDSYESVEYDVQQEDVIAEDQPTYRNGHGGAPAARTAPPPPRANYQNSQAATAQTTQRASPTEFKIDSKRTLLLRKLRLGDKISDGEKLQVYKGEYNREDAVIKKLTKKGMSDEAIVQELRNEIMVMCTLNHENVMKCVAASLKKPDFVLVMPHMKRGSLFEVLYKARIQLTSAMIKKMMFQIASAMANIHANGFIHRDLKSLNILVDSSYNIKIGDFGCTRHVSEASSDIGKGLIGTYQYMAPEVLSGQPHSFKSDVFAFAIVLCEIVSGTPPFHGMDPRSVAEKVVQDNVRPVIPMSCPRPYIELIQKCWSPVPMRRPSFKQVVETLKTIK